MINTASLQESWHFKILEKPLPNQHFNEKFCLYRSIDRHSPDPGSQATFCGGHKTTVLIWPVC